MAEFYDFGFYPGALRAASERSFVYAPQVDYSAQQYDEFKLALANLNSYLPALSKLTVAKGEGDVFANIYAPNFDTPLLVISKVQNQRMNGENDLVGYELKDRGRVLGFFDNDSSFRIGTQKETYRVAEALVEKVAELNGLRFVRAPKISGAPNHYTAIAPKN